MKKSFTLLTLFLLSSFMLHSQETITIGSGTDRNYGPVSGYYGYERTLMLYRSDELSQGSILSMALQAPSATSGDIPTLIYFKEVAWDNIPETSELIWNELISDATLVYEGMPNITSGSGWYTIPTTAINTFNYLGTGNLLVLVATNKGSNGGSGIEWRLELIGNTTNVIYTTYKIDNYIPNDDVSLLANYNDIGTSKGLTGQSSANFWAPNARWNTQFVIESAELSCAAVSDLAISDILPNNAIITWTQGGDETEWLLSYKRSTETDWSTEIQVTNDPTYHLVDLNSNSLYNVRVRSVCGIGDTGTYSNVSFRTSCESITAFPYVEDFDGYGTGETVMPNCWTRITTSTANRPYIRADGAIGNCLYFQTGSTGYNLAIMPPIDETINVSDLMISFTYKGNSMYDTLQIGIMTDATDANTFERITSVSSASVWRDFEIFLSSYTGTGRFIAFKVNNPSSSYGYLDNVEVDGSPVCDGPINLQLTLSTVAPVIADLTWEGGPDDIGWRYQLTNLTTGDASPEGVLTLEDGTTYSFSGLTEGQEYRICVRSECRAGLLSAVVCTTFRAPIVTNIYTITVTRDPANGGTITPPGPISLAQGSAQSFAITPNANFTIEQVLLDGNVVSLTTGDTTEGVYTISNIAQNHLLHVRFKDHTGVDENNLSKEVTLYPNPAQNAIYIETQSLYKRVEVVNVIGEVIYSGNVENLKFDLNISGYASGLYLVRLYGDQGTATKKFVKE